MGEALLAEFECPVCVSYMASPIRQCVQGHLFCYMCFTKIESCAVCRDDKSDDRCLALERVHALLVFPCRYRDDGAGCGYTGTPAELATHELSCLSMKCPLKFHGCQWKGKLLEVAAHCKIEHEDYFHETRTLELLTRQFPTLQLRHIIISAFSTLFRCSWEVDPKGVMRISVYHIGNPSIAESFYFELGIVTKYENNVVTFPCHQAYEHSLCLQQDKYLKFSGHIGEARGAFKKRSYIQFWITMHRMKSDTKLQVP